MATRRKRQKLDNNIDLLCNLVKKGKYKAVNEFLSSTLIDESTGISKKGRDYINCRDSEGHTPLRIACDKNFLKIAKILIKNGCHINFEELFGNLYYKVDFSNELMNIVNFIMKEVPKKVAAANIDEFHFLHVVCCNEEFPEDFINSILQIASNVNAYDDRGSMTPLMRAAEVGNLPAMKVLLHNKAHVNQLSKNAEGASALHYACDDKHSLNIVKVLLKYNADVNIQDVLGRSPLFYAIRCLELDVVDLLLKSKADVNFRDFKGNTVLHYSFETCDFYEDNDAWIRWGLATAEQIVKILILNEFDTGLKNNENKTIFEVKQVETIMMTIEKSLDEIRLLKNTLVNRKFSLYDFIKLNNQNELSQYASNLPIIRCLEDPAFNDKFSVYGYEISKKYDVGLKRRKILDMIAVRFQYLTGLDLPDHCILGICNYFSNFELASRFLSTEW